MRLNPDEPGTRGGRRRRPGRGARHNKYQVRNTQNTAATRRGARKQRLLPPRRFPVSYTVCLDSLCKVVRNAGFSYLARPRVSLSIVRSRAAGRAPAQVPSSDPVGRLVTVGVFGLPAKARRGGTADVVGCVQQRWQGKGQEWQLEARGPAFGVGSEGHAACRRAACRRGCPNLPHPHQSHRPEQSPGHGGARAFRWRGTKARRTAWPEGWGVGKGGEEGEGGKGGASPAPAAPPPPQRRGRASACPCARRPSQQRPRPSLRPSPLRPPRPRCLACSCLHLAACLLHEEGRAVGQACGETSAVASRVLLAKPHRACRRRPPPPRPRAAQLRQQGQLGPRRRRAARRSAGWWRRPRLAARPRRHRLCRLPCACPCRDPVVGAAGAPQRGRRWPTPRRTGLRASRMHYAEAGARA